MWRPGGTLRSVVLALATYAAVAPRRPIGKRGPETERSPAGAAAVSPVGASRCEATHPACHRSVQRSRRSDGRDRGGPGLAPRAEFLTVSEAHEVAVPRSLKVQAREPDFESDREGVRAAHGVTLTTVLGVNHHRESLVTS
jgi:hypothetical protein